MTASLVTRCALGLALALPVATPALAARVLKAPGGGAVRALVMGINHYSSLGAAAQLRGARADADGIVTALKAAGVAPGSVVELLDEAVTRAAVIAEMDRLVASSKSGDLVIITYSGHGMKVSGYKRWENQDRFHSQIALAAFNPGDDNKGHEVIVDAEMRAWYARLDAKGVDMLVVMDTCYGGRMREVVPGGPGVTTRDLSVRVADRVHDSFKPIAMTEAEAGADANGMRHLTFFAGATPNTTVPEVTLDANKQPRGALSYFMSHVISGELQIPGVAAGPVTRRDLFTWLSPQVVQATAQLQFIDYGPRPLDNDTAEQTNAAERQSVFVIAGSGDPGPVAPQPVAVDAPATKPAHPHDPDGAAVKVAVTGGPPEALASIRKGKAPFVQSEAGDAEVIWDVAGSRALTQTDSIMDHVDGSVLGAVIDRTFAVREIRKLAVQRIIDVKIGDDGRRYTYGESPRLVASGVNGTWITAFNIAADGTVQCLLQRCDNPKMSQDQWTYFPQVVKPYGTDYAVVIATSAPAQGLHDWLRAHNDRKDAFDAVAMLKDMLGGHDGDGRLGTAGLFTAPPQRQ